MALCNSCIQIERTNARKLVSMGLGMCACIHLFLSLPLPPSLSPSLPLSLSLSLEPIWIFHFPLVHMYSTARLEGMYIIRDMQVLPNSDIMSEIAWFGIRRLERLPFFHTRKERALRESVKGPDFL